MKVAQKVVFLLRDEDGFAEAVAESLHPNSNSSLHRVEDSFELPLDKYGIKDDKASGKVVSFVDGDGVCQASVLVLQAYEPPALVCALSEVLAQIIQGTSPMPTIVAPFLVATSKLKFEKRHMAAKSNKISLYGVHMGPETENASFIAAKVEKPPSSLQIHYEPLSCFLHLIRVLKLPTSILIGQRSQNMSDKAVTEELQVLSDICDILASSTDLCFSRDKIAWSPSKTSRGREEPWRTLYG